MKLFELFSLMSDPTEIEQIYAINDNGDIIHRFTYCEEETEEEYRNFWQNCDYPPDEEELEIYCKEFQIFRNHLDSEVIEVELLDRCITVKAKG